MMERYNSLLGFRLCDPGSTLYSLWETLGTVLKDGRSGSIVEVGRILDNGITFDFDVPGFAEFYGMELGRIFHHIRNTGQVRVIFVNESDRESEFDDLWSVECAARSPVR